MNDSTLGNRVLQGRTTSAPKRAGAVTRWALAAVLAGMLAPSSALADPNGACCFADGSCTFEFNFACPGLGGSYQGDDTDCDPNPCPQPPSTTTTTLDEGTTTTTLPETTTTTVPDTTTTTVPDTTTTLPETTTTTLPDTTTTTSTLPETTTTTLAVGACCAGNGCFETTESLCLGEFVGTFQGDGSSCEDTGVCVDCPSGCLNFGEQCDDGNTANGDGCDSDCQEEACFDCNEEQSQQLTGNVPIGPICIGPSTCGPEISEACEVCGNETVGPGEQCDDGNSTGGDCCSATCQYEAFDSPCPDEQFCDGPETCDGSGNCIDSKGGADCSSLDGECTIGYCDFKLDACVADTSELEGVLCGKDGTCVVANSGVCTDGVCVGDATFLDETCRWILIAGSPEGPVRYQNGKGSIMNANACGDFAKSAGISTASIVATATAMMGEGIRFYGPPEVAGDIVTGGSSVGANLYVKIPGTELKTVASGATAPKLPSGIVDATGDHELVQVCLDDKAALDPAADDLDAMTTTETKGNPPGGYKISSGGSDTIDVTGDGLAVVEMAGLKVGHGATLTLKGNPTDVIMIRVTGSRLKFGYGAQLLLDGIVPGNVLFYSQGSRCRVSPGVVGSGTMFCPKAASYKIGVGVQWSGTFLGGTRRVQVRKNANLMHVPFTGF